MPASRGFRVTMLHHPSHHVPDLDAAVAWFERVFGRPSTSIAVVLAELTVRPDWPRDYSCYTPIADVFFDSIQPDRFVIDGVQHYPTITEPHLKDLGWSVEGHAEAYRAIRSRGFRITNSIGEVAEGDDPPKGPNDPAPFFTQREETGLRYAFYPAMEFPVDARTEPGWTLPPVSDDDPLRIRRCSHHTVLTGEPERGVALFAEALGGDVVHEGRNELLGATSTWVHVGDTTLEFAVPDPGTAAHDDWAASEPLDTYHAITWHVADLDAVERHLAAEGVAVRARSDDTIVTDPATSLGIPWGFTTALVPGDPRRG